MRQLINFLSILITLSLSQGCFAQYVPAKIEVSSEQVRVNGDLYYLHKVEKRQTLYSISKTYGVPADTIVKDNPKVASGLKEGDLIYVRVVENPREDIAQDQDAAVKKQDTTAKEPPLVQENEIRTYHVVRWYETLSSIARKYNVTEEDIALINNLTGNKVKTRQNLKIPYLGYAEKFHASDAIPQKDDKSRDLISKDEKEIPDSEFRKKRGRFSTIRAKLLLPLGGKSHKYSEESDRVNNFMEFYQGFLVALNDLKESHPNISLDLEVIDTDNYATISEIIETGRLDNSHIIFGPVFSEQLEPIVDYAKNKEIYVVSPMDPESDFIAGNNPHFFQVSTPVPYQQRGILSAVNFMSNVTLIFEDRDTGTDELTKITSDILNSGDIRYNQISYNILKGRSILPQIEQRLSKGTINHVIVASNSEAFVSDVLRNLNLLKTRRDYDIVIYGTPVWRSFESVDIAYYHEMNLNISMQYYLDFERQNVKEFLAKFRALYGSEPTPYAFQAYDIAAYFLGNIWNEGTFFLENANRYKSEMLQSDYNFIRDGKDGGYINTAIRRIIYRQDFSTTDIRGFFR